MCIIKNKNSFVFIILLFVTSCVKQEYFVLDKVIYVDKFPVESSVQDAEILEIDAVGLSGIKVFDDYLLFSQLAASGCLTAFTKDGTPISNPFLNVGRGPGEVLYTPFISWMSFRKDENGDIIGGICDFKGCYIECDIDKAVRYRTPEWETVTDTLPFVSGARYYRIGRDSLLCGIVNHELTGYERYIVDEKGNLTTTPAIDILNSKSSPEYNLFASHFIYNESRGIVAELGSRLSVVHLYSLWDDFRVTLISGNQQENVRKIEKISYESMPQSYEEAKEFDNFFAALYTGTTIKASDEGKVKDVQLQIFGWDGSPLARLYLPLYARSFDIDVPEGKLYVIDNEERVLRYDISGVLESIGRCSAQL